VAAAAETAAAAVYEAAAATAEVAAAAAEAAEAAEAEAEAVALRTAWSSLAATSVGEQASCAVPAGARMSSNSC